MFHPGFARLLWVGVKTHSDTLVALSFLEKRTSRPDEDDWVKLERLLLYLQDAIDMPLTLGIDGLQVVKWWADASFAIHPDMKSHSGFLGSLKRGAIFARSVTQQLNTISNTNLRHRLVSSSLECESTFAPLQSKECEVVDGSEALA